MKPSFTRRDFAAQCALSALQLRGQGVASRGVKPSPRGKPSGLPFHARFHRYRRSRRPACAGDLWRRWTEDVRPRIRRLRRRVLRLRQRRLARHLPSEWHAAGRRAGRYQSALQEQSRRHLHRRHREGRPAAHRLGIRGGGRRLQQRRLRRSVRHLLGPKRSLPQQRRRHVHRRDEASRPAAAGRRAGARAARSSITIAMACSICSSPTTSSSTSNPCPQPGGNSNCNWKGIPVLCGPRGLPPGIGALYRNNGDGTFTDVSEASGVTKAKGSYMMTAVAADFNNDGWPDIYVACDSTPSFLFRNNQDGTFTEHRTGIRRRAQRRRQSAGGHGSGHRRLQPGRPPRYFQDALLRRHQHSVSQRRQGDSSTTLPSPRGLGVETRFVGWGAGIVDLDNDGLPDLFLVTGGVFPEVAAKAAGLPDEHAARDLPQSGQRAIRRVDR